MKLCEILNEGNILLPVKSIQQNDAIQELLDHLQKMGYITGTKKLYTDTSNTCLRACSCELRKYLNSNLPNYCHLPISTQIIANFNSSF